MGIANAAWCLTCARGVPSARLRSRDGEGCAWSDDVTLRHLDFGVRQQRVLPCHNSRHFFCFALKPHTTAATGDVVFRDRQTPSRRVFTRDIRETRMHHFIPSRAEARLVESQAYHTIITALLGCVRGDTLHSHPRASEAKAPVDIPCRV